MLLLSFSSWRDSREGQVSESRRSRDSVTIFRQVFRPGDAVIISCSTAVGRLGCEQDKACVQRIASSLQLAPHETSNVELDAAASETQRATK